MAKKASRKDRQKVSAGRRIQEHQTGFSGTSLELPEGVKFFKPEKAGSVRMTIVPYTVGKGNPFADEGSLYYERTFHAHRGVGANSETYLCLAKTFNKSCPICEERSRLAKTGGDEQLIKDLAPKERQLWNVLVQGQEEDGVQLWDVSFHLFGKLLDDRIKTLTEEEQDDRYELFADPEDGSLLRVSFNERSFGGHSFFEASAIDFMPRKEPLDQETLDQANCLDEILKEVDYDKLKGIFLETDDDEDEEEEPKPKKTAAKKSTAKKKVEEEPEPDDTGPHENVGEAADEGDENAIDTLTKAAAHRDLDPNDYETWVELEEALKKAAAADKKKPAAKKQTKKPAAKKQTKKPAAKAKGPDFAALGEAADEDDEGAQGELEQLAADAGLDPNDYELWAELATELASGSDDEVPFETEKEESEEDDADDEWGDDDWD